MSASEKTRIACRIARARAVLSDAGDSRESAAAGTGHVETCPDCRAYFAAGNALTSRLRRDAVQNSQEVPGDLEQRIISAVAASARPLPAPRSRMPFILLAGGIAAAILAVLLVQNPHNLAARRPIARETSAKAPQNAGDSAMLAEIWNSLTRTSGDLVEQTPLKKEADSVYADFRSAVNFLALNFLPSSTAPASDSKTPVSVKQASG